jgi:hypothetical protein
LQAIRSVGGGFPWLDLHLDAAAWPGSSRVSRASAAASGVAAAGHRWAACCEGQRQAPHLHLSSVPSRRGSCMPNCRSPSCSP